MIENEDILEAFKFIKKNSPKLHLYICGKFLENTTKGSLRIKMIDARRILGSIFHISKQSQITILKELEMYKLLLPINRKEYLIPISPEDYEELYQQPLKQVK